jgi:hypothetical protein
MSRRYIATAASTDLALCAGKRVGAQIQLDGSEVQVRILRAISAACYGEAFNRLTR